MKQGRPKKLNAEYFPHFTNANKDERMFLLIKAFGPQGYGIYWLIKEELASKDYFLWKVEESLQLESFCSLRYIKKDKFYAILNKCLEVELFDREAYKQKYLFSHDLVYDLHKSGLFYFREIKLVNIYEYLKEKNIKLEENKKLDILEKCTTFSGTAEQGSIIKEKERKEKADDPKPFSSIVDKIKPNKRLVSLN